MNTITVQSKEKLESNTTSGVNKVGIFIRSYDRDAKWLRYTLPILLQKAHGYDDITIVGISDECADVITIADENNVRFVPDNLAAQISDGYINQQYSKMRADLFLPDMDYIVYVDSDVVCLEEHGPDIWFDDGKPLMLHSRWEDVGDAKCWKDPTTDAVGKVPPYEFMRRLPLCYHRDTIYWARQQIEGVNGELSQYMDSLRGFSEFNALGCYAWYFDKDNYKWVNPQDEYVDPLPFKQYWSWGNMEEQLNGK